MRLSHAARSVSTVMLSAASKLSALLRATRSSLEEAFLTLLFLLPKSSESSKSSLSVVFEKKSFSLPPKGRGFGGGRLPLPPPFSLLLPRVSSVEVVFVFASSKPVDDNDIGNRLFL